MKCKLLYVVGQLRPGGSERQLYYLLKGLDRTLYQPEVVVWSFDESDTYVRKIRELDIPLHSFPPTLSGATKLRTFHRLVRRLSPRIVHSYTFYTNFAAFCAAIGSSSIAIGGVRSDFATAKHESGAVLGRLSGRWPRCQVFNSAVVAASVRKSRGFFVPKHYNVIRNGLDLELFPHSPMPTAGKPQIVGVGSMLPNKRWDRLLSAACLLRQQQCEFSIRIVGNGPLLDYFKERTCALGISDCVEFSGHRDDIAAVIAQAHFVVHPSDSEGCPNAVMEAMACGRAVIATDVGEVADLVEDGITGFVVPRRDDALLVARMAILLKDMPLCSTMGNAARHKAEQEFGVDRLVSETLTAYRAAGLNEW